MNDKNDKEEIRKNPWKVYITAKRHFSFLNSKVMYIEIELTEENNNLFLLSKGFGKGKGKVNILKKFHNYDANGRNYFEKLLPHLGKVWIFIGGEKKPRVFSSYENFLSEITVT